MEQMEKKPKKRPGKDFVSELSGKKTKRDYVGLGTPNKKKIKIKDDKSDFAGKNKAPKTIVKKNKVSKPKVVTPKMIKDAGFTTLRDYLNDKRGLTRKDGKKPVKVGDKKTKVVKAPKVPPKAPNRGKNKLVSSLKISRSGIDGGSSQVNKAKKKIVKKNPMSTKTPKTFKGTNITPTKLQRDRMRKRAMGST